MLRPCKSVFIKLTVLLLCFLPATGYTETTKDASPNKSSTHDLKGNVPADEWLDSRRALFDKVISKSKEWLDTVNPNPFILRRHGIKGKKKIVELFEGYLAIYKFLSAAEQKIADKRLRDITAIAQIPPYHNMSYLNDKQFREDATSYLRLCYLMERKGLDTTLYRQEIKKILPRLNKHMPTRGPNQQMTFAWYYEYFGLDEPFPLAKAYEKGVIARRLSPDSINRFRAYALTHEIYAVYYRLGDKLNTEFFSEDDKIYLRGVLNKLIDRYIKKDDIDITAELVSCMVLLRMEDEPIFKTAVDYLLSRQNPGGSFGNYEWLKKIYGDYVKEGFYLHTTEVVLYALALTFDKP